MQLSEATPFKRRDLYLAIGAFFLMAIVYFLLPSSFSLEEKQTILIFLFAALFWAFEIIPLYATSIIIVIALTVTFSIQQANPIPFTHYLIPFSSPVIMLFFGGFILGAAAKKHSIDIYFIEKMLGRLGSKSWVILIGFLAGSALFSLWISNTAATAMMLLLAKPVLTHLHKDDPLRKGLILAIAFGANAGGVGTPIGTPPNAIAIGLLAENNVIVDFLSWMGLTIPLAIILLTLIAITLLVLFPPRTKNIEFLKRKKSTLSSPAIGSLCIGLLMILLWLTTPLHHIPEAITALLGVGLFAAFRLINAEDIKSIDWDILILMWGGLALGQGIQMSGLLKHLFASPLFAINGLGLIAVFAIISIFLSSFISNTAAANILLPITASLAFPNNILLSLVIALSCSFAFALPISTPPNAMAYATGTFSIKEMIKAGGIISGLSFVIILLAYLFVYRYIF